MSDKRGNTEWMNLVNHIRRELIARGEAKGAEATRLALKKAKPIYRERKELAKKGLESTKDVF